MSATSYLEDTHRGYRHPFIFGSIFFGGVGDNPRTLADLAMARFSADLRRRPQWWKRHRDKEQQTLWGAEAVDRHWVVEAPSSVFRIRLSPAQIQYVIDELEGYAALRDEPNTCQVSCFERIWESNSLVLDDDRLLADLEKLRSSQRRGGKNHVETVLIDPLLHSLVYHRTLVRTSLSHFPHTLPPPVSNDIYTISLDFSCLPSDVSVSPDASKAEFKSYINNIHPTRHKSICHHLESLLARSIPLFEHTLTDLHRNNPLVQRIRGACRYSVWEEPDAPEFSDDEESWAQYEREMRGWVMNRPIQLPEVPRDGYSGGMEQRRHEVSLRGRQIQVITRVSEIHLIPGGPEFPGSDWRVEGMRAERVVACNLHFIQYENVTPSSLEFRMAVAYPRGFMAGDTGATLRTWGFNDGDGCHQHIGSIPLQKGLSVSFPNIYQSRRSGFRLVDPEKEGRVVVVTFLLVDPEIRPVVSTAMVPPQQETWIKEAAYEALITRLPAELVEAILGELDGFLTLEEADNYRMLFVEALERFTQASNSNVNKLPSPNHLVFSVSV